MSANLVTVFTSLLVANRGFVLECGVLLSAGADTGGVDRVDIHPPFFSKKKFEMSLYLK